MKDKNEKFCVISRGCGVAERMRATAESLQTAFVKIGSDAKKHPLGVLIALFFAFTVPGAYRLSVPLGLVYTALVALFIARAVGDDIAI